MSANVSCQTAKRCLRINVVRTVQTISVVIDWHVSSWATINSLGNNPTRGLELFVFAGSIFFFFVGQDAEGTLLRKEYLTICQKTEYQGTRTVETRTFSSISKRCLWTPTAAPEPETQAALLVNCRTVPTVTDCGMIFCHLSQSNEEGGGPCFDHRDNALSKKTPRSCCGA